MAYLHSPLYDDFLSLLTEFAEFAHRTHSIKPVVTYPHEVDFLRTKFSKLPMVLQAKKLQKFSLYFSHYKEMDAAGVSFLDKKGTFLSFLKMQGLRIPHAPEILDVLSERTLIEIYDIDSVQSYRSIDFFSIFSQSMMALECCEWWELYERSPEVSENIRKKVAGILGGTIHGPLFNPVDVHTIRESGATSSRKTFQIEPLLFSPVYNKDGFLTGGLHVFKVQSIHDADLKIWR